MSVVAEGITSLVGLWRVVRLDASGLSYLRATPEGFLRSFWAAAIVTPIHLSIDLIRGGPLLETAGVLLFLVVHILTSITLWGAIPLMMWHVTDAIGRRDRFYIYATGYNWMHVLLLPLSLASWLLVDVIGVASGTAALIQTAVIGLSYGLIGLLCHLALRVTSLAAIGLVMLDFIVSYLIVGLSAGVYY